jgi:2,5-dihydroxypyridine 5,6-dioxygenase
MNFRKMKLQIFFHALPSCRNNARHAMISDRIEAKWIDTFRDLFALCHLPDQGLVAILSETQSRSLTLQVTELALAQLGLRWFHVQVPTPRQTAPVPVRSTGASSALQGNSAVIAALSASAMVVDLTLEGLLHAPELPAVLAQGARLMMISNEHPEALERMAPDPALKPKVLAGAKRLKAARMMQVTSAAGTDLRIDVADAPTAGVFGWADRPGQVAHWPGGLCLCFPRKGSVNGRLVLAPGDANLTFNRYVRDPITLTVADDYVTDVVGGGLDGDLMRSYFAAWGDRDSYAVSHVGWGMNPKARWEALTFYDRRDTNGTELRAFAGNFLFSTGANEAAGRHALGHFDLPMRNCTIRLDGVPVVLDGMLQGDLA